MERGWFRKDLILIGATILLASLSCGCVASEPSAASSTADVPAPESRDELIARGQYLVRIGSCNDCHTRGSSTRSSASRVPTTRVRLGTSSHGGSAVPETRGQVSGGREAGASGETFRGQCS